MAKYFTVSFKDISGCFYIKSRRRKMIFSLMIEQLNRSNNLINRNNNKKKNTRVSCQSFSMLRPCDI